MDAAGLSLSLVALSYKIIVYLQNEWQKSPQSSRDPSLSALFTSEGVLHQIGQQLASLAGKLFRGPSKSGRFKTAVLWPFKEEEARQILRRVHDLTGQATHFVSQSSHGMLQTIRADMAAVRFDTSAIRNDTATVRDTVADDHFRKLLDWLSPLRSRDTQREILGDSDPNTWVFESKPFLSWRDDKDVQTLCFDIEDSKKLRGIGGNLFSQALPLRHGVPAALRELHLEATTGTGNQRSVLKNLEEIFVKYLESFDVVFLLLDGLDEVSSATERATIINVIHSYGPNVKVMITSRRLGHIEEALDNPRLCSRCRFPSTVGLWYQRKSPREAVCEICRGSDETKLFLLARLHVDSFDDNLTAGDVRQNMESLSNELDQIHEQAFLRMKKTLVTRHWNILQQILLWVAWAEAPLSTSALGHASAIKPGMSRIASDNMLHVRDLISSIYDLLSRSRKFLVNALYYLDAGWRTTKGIAPLHVASHMSLTDVARELIRDGEDVNIRDSLGTTPLVYAASNGADNSEYVDVLLAAGADLSLQCQMKSTAFTRALKSKSEAVAARILQESNVSINSESKEPTGKGETAILIAIKNQQRHILHMILKRREADPNFFSGVTPSPLRYAIEHYMTWAVEALLSRDDIRVESKESSFHGTPLKCATRYFFPEAVMMLRKKGANFRCPDDYGGRFHASSGWIKFLLDCNFDAHATDNSRRNACHSAAINNALEALQFLLSEVPDLNINLQDSNGRTPLHDACQRMTTEGVKALVAAGARCDLKDSHGLTPFDVAQSARKDDIVEILKNASGDMDRLYEHNGKKYTPLSFACYRRKTDMVEMLLEAGASDMASAMREAIQAGALDCFRVLLAKNADINATTKRQSAIIADGSPFLQEALLWATQEKRLAVIKRLLRAGASMHIKLPGYPYTAGRVAEVLGLDDVLDLMAELRGENSSSGH
ncbi:ankyrin repeat-containing protein [Colletotrichum musicola]|uniref:Ankyrin repeat-containing protein n=1 Tax=Colletotrichum musicola TaxID=2175873 RepID=A0A8H6K1B2_9PEZI|nr:ankyrin repeat-containing protein [Colletotrichum musicola]